jgi:hypothetical protein
MLSSDLLGSIALVRWSEVCERSTAQFVISESRRRLATLWSRQPVPCAAVSEKAMVLGVISDTHGLLRPAAVEPLIGCDRILHAGDVGAREILEELARIAVVTAVRGNMDTAPWARALPETEVVEAGACVHLYPARSQPP